MTPSWRKPVGMSLILLLILVWCVGVASLSVLLGRLPALAQAPIYAFLGIAWIAPLKPLLRWMELGGRR
ncbi:DUF2842 domain-containing protein [Sphingomonas sp. AP4-R1]|uniref:DUF2842 domain-containing protein n=1 Tax=Sphingomonas sp. AP4-R1 TaxID=2735134 RepID=UPI00149335CD|nr:DUF2842 domain-containing protein [Sphingomonas sp. AP4-R1]QJU58818.1 DUF2842 domain-containing protein [Sphingomonas sp. AP4-R1]